MSITSQTPRNFHFDLPTTPNVVGPGAYEYRSCFTPSKKTRIPFGTTTRRDLWNIPDGQEDVGPGHYEPQPVSRSPSCLTNIHLESKRQYFIDNHQSPSPADHAPIQHWGQKRPKTGLTNRPRNMRPLSPPPKQPKQELPGPGSYDLINNEIDTDHACAFSASRSPQREPARYNGVPGPGSYGKITDSTDKPSNNKPSPAFKCKDKRIIFNNPVNDSVMPNHVAWMPEIFEGRPFGSNISRELDWKSPGKESPGPAIHSSQSKRTFTKQTLPFGSNRVTYQSSLNENPGPGYYDNFDKSTSKPKSKLPSFNKAPRAEIWDVQITPSPGQYEEFVAEKIERCLTLRTASPAFKDRSERYQNYVKEDPNPGPGVYYAKSPQKKHYSKFNRDVRFRDDNYVGPLKMNDSPSPANYTVETETTKKRVVGGQKVKARRFEKNSQNSKVGPGKYGGFECEMIKPSYNVKFDPELKKKSDLKKLYT